MITRPDCLSACNEAAHHCGAHGGTTYSLHGSQEEREEKGVESQYLLQWLTTYALTFFHYALPAEGSNSATGWTLDIHDPNYTFILKTDAAVLLHFLVSCP
jgi:hypothetical protein